MKHRHKIRRVIQSHRPVVNTPLQPRRRRSGECQASIGEQLVQRIGPRLVGPDFGEFQRVPLDPHRCRVHCQGPIVFEILLIQVGQCECYGLESNNRRHTLTPSTARSRRR
ncbi:MAG: hypothetical protein KIT54_00230 [Phycisphaeraceae bacterium]|nr:hypothetical protein [Phycisphaeraceae bacterium]